MAYTFDYTHNAVTKTVTIVDIHIDPQNEIIHYTLQITDQWDNVESLMVTCCNGSTTFDFSSNEAALEADASTALDECYS